MPVSTVRVCPSALFFLSFLKRARDTLVENIRLLVRRQSRMRASRRDIDGRTDPPPEQALFDGCGKLALKKLGTSPSFFHSRVLGYRDSSFVKNCCCVPGTRNSGMNESDSHKRQEIVPQRAARPLIGRFVVILRSFSSKFSRVEHSWACAPYLRRSTHAVG